MIHLQFMRSISILTAILVFCVGQAFAGFINFEDGVDGQAIASTIPGLEFTHTGGYDWVYGDWRTGDYNGPYPYGPDPFKSQYYSDGNFFAWLGIYQGSGIITFTQSYATYFQIGYSTPSIFYLKAYDDQGSLLDQDIGYDNLDTGRMDYLRVEAPGMAYVLLHDSGNYWLVDNLETDAIQQCTVDAHCDDGVYCNGEEYCEQWMCYDGDPVACEDDALYCNGDEECSEQEQGCIHTGLICEDDGLFCNGDEICSEQEQGCTHTGFVCEDDGLFCNGDELCSEDAQGCSHSGDPCTDETCDEETDTCNDTPPDIPGVTDDDEEEEEGGEEELWPKGEVTGGCGC